MPNTMATTFQFVARSWAKALSCSGERFMLLPLSLSGNFVDRLAVAVVELGLAISITIGIQADSQVVVLGEPKKTASLLSSGRQIQVARLALVHNELPGFGFLLKPDLDYYTTIQIDDLETPSPDNITNVAGLSGCSHRHDCRGHEESHRSPRHSL